MKIGIDCRMMGHPGIGRYISSLLKQLVIIKSQHLFYLYGDAALFKLSQYYQKNNCVVRNWIAPVYPIFPIRLPSDKDNLDILHVPHFNVPSFYAARKLVVTIHDLTYLCIRKSAPSLLAREYVRLNIRKAMQKSRAVITVSQFTKDEILRYFADACESKITVIHEAAGGSFKQTADDATWNAIRLEYRIGQCKFPERFILHVGSLKVHKNIETLLEAWQISKRDKQLDEFELVFVGVSNKRERFLQKKIENAGAYYIGYMKEFDFVLVYSRASLVVIPSLYEGFGLPLLEAMQAGVPVLASSAGALPEIGGDAACYFNPRDPKELAEKINQMMSCEDLRQNFIKKGQARVEYFSWKTAAEETLRLYEKI